MPEWLLNSNYINVKIIGEVENAQEFINSKAVMIVPLLSGSGIRIKIIEGMASGKTVISTKIGAEGINYENGKNILIANTPYEFSEAIKKCVRDQDYCNMIGRNARILIKNEYNNNKIIKKLMNFYKEIL